jgi:sugar/nucleoside kinase (ribokinase family)
MDPSTPRAVRDRTGAARRVGEAAPVGLARRVGEAAPVGLVRVVGEIMIDTVVVAHSSIAWGSDTPATIEDHDGGSAANMAAWLASTGTPVELIACVGDDHIGGQALDRLRSAGIDVNVRRSPDHRTGRCLVIVAADGERTMLPDPGANIDLGPADLNVAGWSADDHLHVSGYTLMRSGPRVAAIHALEAARQRGLTVSVDASSSAPLRDLGAEVILDVCVTGDVLFANADEARALTGRADPVEAAEFLAGHGLVAVVKLGPHGALAVDGSRTVRRAAAPVASIDSTGAGDAFAAGFLAAWRLDASLASAVESATRLAAQAVGRLGARP